MPPAARSGSRPSPTSRACSAWRATSASLQRDLQDSEKLVERIERAMQSGGRTGIFPDLAAARTRSVEIENQLVDVRQKFVRQGARDPRSRPDARRAQDAGPHRRRARRPGAPAQEPAPTRQERSRRARRRSRSQYRELDGSASELNVEIQSLEAQLVAIEQYYRSSRSEQKIRPEDIQRPVKDLRVAIDEPAHQHDKMRDDIADAVREASTAGRRGRTSTMPAAPGRAPAPGAGGAGARQVPPARRHSSRQVDRVNGVLARADAIGKQLDEFDQRVDAQADVRLEKVRGYLATEKEELRQAGTKLGVVVGRVAGLGGGLAQAMFTQRGRPLLRPGRSRPTSASSTSPGA